MNATSSETLISTVELDMNKVQQQMDVKLKLFSILNNELEYEYQDIGDNEITKAVTDESTMAAINTIMERFDVKARA